jgi:hypothetical protein
MSWVAAAVAGSAIIGGVSASNAAKKSAKASKNATNATLAENARQFDLARADTAPYREAGVGALDSIRRIFMGGDMSAIRNDPGYQFTRSEGLSAGADALGSMGMRQSGRAVKAAERYATGLADNQANSVFNRLATIAGIGTSGVNTSANAGANAAGNNSAALMQNGANRASAYMQGGAGVNNAIQGGMSNLLLQRYLTPSSGGAPGYSAMNYRGPMAGGGLA